MCVYVITFLELGRFHGRVTSSDHVLRVHVQFVCILLAWKSTDGTGKKYILLQQHESKHTHFTGMVSV